MTTQWVFPEMGIPRICQGCETGDSPKSYLVTDFHCQALLARWGKLAYFMDMTDWDERYRLGDTPWEKGNPAPPLLELIERMGAGIFGEGPVLVPGCGLGHDVRALAANGVLAVGLDISTVAIERAREIPVVGGETYECGNFLDPTWRVGWRFSAIWEHTCFCAIDPDQRQNYAQSVAGLLGQGGILAGVFFLTPHDPGEEEVGPPFATTVEELEQWFSPWFERIEGWVPQRAYPGREGREWTGLFRRRTQAGVAAEVRCP